MARDVCGCVLAVVALVRFVVFLGGRGDVMVLLGSATVAAAASDSSFRLIAVYSLLFRDDNFEVKTWSEPDDDFDDLETVLLVLLRTEGVSVRCSLFLARLDPTGVGCLKLGDSGITKGLPVVRQPPSSPCSSARGRFSPLLSASACWLVIGHWWAGTWASGAGGGRG